MYDKFTEYNVEEYLNSLVLCTNKVVAVSYFKNKEKFLSISFLLHVDRFPENSHIILQETCIQRMEKYFDHIVHLLFFGGLEFSNSKKDR